jgi:HEPN domain-containing protein
MNERPDKNAEIKKWIDRADHDILAAKQLVELAELSDIVCFHCQQCVEKYLKCLLLFYDVDFPKTHDLRLLLQLAQKHCSLDIKLSQIIQLNRYAVEGRYPGEWEPIDKKEAVDSIAIAAMVRSEVRLILPSEIL